MKLMTTATALAATALVLRSAGHSPVIATHFKLGRNETLHIDAATFNVATAQRTTIK